MLFALGVFHGRLHELVFLLEIDVLEQRQRSFCAGLCDKAARTVNGHVLAVLLLREHLFVFQLRISGIGHDPGNEVNDFFQLFRGHIQQQRHPGRNAAQIPDMCDRRSQLDVSHALTAHRGLGDLYAAAVADHAFVTHFLIFSAIAFPVLGRAENAFTEQTVSLRLL